jgi:hypothetical protein
VITVLAERQSARGLATYKPRAYGYQLGGASPVIWRRLIVRGDSTIADLYAPLLRALGWSDEHLNRFVMHGRDKRCRA